jgi:hypothetical protein
MSWAFAKEMVVQREACQDAPKFGKHKSLNKPAHDQEQAHQISAM